MRDCRLSALIPSAPPSHADKINVDDFALVMAGAAVDNRHAPMRCTPMGKGASLGNEGADVGSSPTPRLGRL